MGRRVLSVVGRRYCIEGSHDHVTESNYNSEKSNLS